MILSYHNSNGPSRFVQCDICKREGFDADTASFGRVKQAIRARGWATFPRLSVDAGQRPKWLHACPNCARERANDIRVARGALAQRQSEKGEAA